MASGGPGRSAAEAPDGRRYVKNLRRRGCQRAEDPIEAALCFAWLWPGRRRANFGLAIFPLLSMLRGLNRLGQRPKREASASLGGPFCLKRSAGFLGNLVL